MLWINLFVDKLNNLLITLCSWLVDSLILCKFIYHSAYKDLKETCFRVKDNIVLVSAMKVLIFMNARDNAGSSDAFWLRLSDRFISESPAKENGQRTTDNGQRTTDNGQRTTGNGQRATGNGQLFRIKTIVSSPLLTASLSRHGCHY